LCARQSGQRLDGFLDAASGIEVTRMTQEGRIRRQPEPPPRLLLGERQREARQIDSIGQHVQSFARCARLGIHVGERTRDAEDAAHRALAKHRAPHRVALLFGRVVRFEGHRVSEARQPVGRHTSRE
jgi:hypothetical protein